MQERRNYSSAQTFITTATEKQNSCCVNYKKRGHDIDHYKHTILQLTTRRRAQKRTQTGLDEEKSSVRPKDWSDSGSFRS